MSHLREGILAPRGGEDVKCSTKRLILLISSLTLGKEPRRIACWVISPNQLST